jgi:ribosomal-protein-alanine N-acetyltransferase
MKLKVAEDIDKKFPHDGLAGDLTKLKLFNESNITSRYVSWLNDPVVVKFSNQRFKFHSKESSLDYLGSFKGTDNLFISIQRTSDEEAIGTMTVYQATHHGTADIGLLIGDRASWGNGLGLDAWNTISYWLKTRRNIRKITAGTLSGNVGMLKIFERSGMVKDGQRTAQELVDGEPMDVIYYARFRDDPIK